VALAEKCPDGRMLGAGTLVHRIGRGHRGGGWRRDMLIEVSDVARRTTVASSSSATCSCMTMETFRGSAPG
jgi:hypothetical protein